MQTSACAAAAAMLGKYWATQAHAESQGLSFGPAEPFSFEALVRTARERAAKAYVPVPRPAPEVMEQMIYDEHEAIHYRHNRALYPESAYPVIFRHLGKLFPSPVKMYAVEARGGAGEQKEARGGAGEQKEARGDAGEQKEAREILYSPELFELPAKSVAKQLPKDAGFAGFALQENGHFDRVDKGFLCFLGASYFRGIGEDLEMGLSARAVAINTAPPGKEEFPGYVSFYIEGAKSKDDPVTVHALLDSPSIAGAYKFVCHRKHGVTMEVDCKLFLREDVDKLGIAPLTSMFWYGEYGRKNHIDWRPEVHDSDGLLLWTGGGQRIFRALENYHEFTISKFEDSNPKGFGLCQRDRNQDHYLDPVNYERRPSLWVEPLSAWGKGHVELVEIPTVDEYHDNLVVYWVPKIPSTKGTAYDFRYRLHWRNDEPYPANLAHVSGTYIGRGGEPATPEPIGVTRFVVEFRGGPPDTLRDRKQLTAKIHTSQGQILFHKIVPVPNTTRYLLHFDVAPAKPGVAELEATLFVAGKSVSECFRYRMEVLAV